MKYTRKVSYFKKGDKFDEALRKLPKEQKEAILKISSTQKEQERKDKLSSVGAGFKRPTAEAIVAPIDTRSAQIKNTVGQTVPKTRGQAFQAARKRGDKEFTWNGKRYHTRTAEEEAALRNRDTAVTVDNIGDTNTEDKSSSVVNSNIGSGVLRLDQQQSETIDNTQKTNATNTAEDEVTKIRDTSPYSGPSIWIDRDKVKNIPQNLHNSGEAAQQFFDGVNLIYKDFEKTTPGKIMNNPTQSQHLLGALPLMLWGKIKKHTNPMFQQGGSIDKLQRGNSFKNTDYSSAGEKRKRIEAYRNWKNSDVATQRLNTMFDNTRKPLKISTKNTSTGEQVKIRPHWTDRILGNSNTMVRQVSPNLQDTIYAIDDGFKRYANYQDGSYMETVPIIGPRRYIGSTPPTREAIKNKFEQHYKKQGGTINKSQRKGGWLFQQGGQMPQEGSQEELVLDFAVRYLVTMGVPETEIMDPQGNLNPEYQQELEQVFNSQEISWSDYAASPDEYMQQFIGNLQAQTQIARKGAKLKRLSKLKIYKK